MTDQRIYYYVTKLSNVFKDVRNEIDSITTFLAKSHGWEYADLLKKFDEYEETKFIIMLYLHRNGLSYDEIISKLKNITAIVLVTDKNVSVDEECPLCSGSGEDECSECDGVGEEECTLCGGSGQWEGEECDRCDGRGKHECQYCDGSGVVTCEECNGDGEVTDYEKTVVSIRTFVTFNPSIINYFRENYKESIPEINQKIEKELHPVSEDDFTLELESRFREVNNYVMEVTSDPKEITQLIIDPSYHLEKEYLWILRR